MDSPDGRGCVTTLQGRAMLLCVTLAALVLPSATQASSANPAGVAFGTVPLNTTVSQNVTITVDAGYRTELASGSGLNAPFAFDFDTCAAGGGFTGPGTCNVKERFTPTAPVV